MQNNKKIISIAVIIVIIAGIFWFFYNNNSFEDQEVSMSEPAEIVIDFYQSWLNALESSDTDPYSEELDDSPILSKELRKQISENKNNLNSDMDLVLCQSVIPTSISSRIVYEQEDRAQVLVLARDEGLNNQAVYTLKKYKEGWYIDNIECSAGEFGPDREFSFERLGVLVKDVPEPYNSENWHVVFVENNELSIVPLFFNGESFCSEGSDDDVVCDPNQISEQAKATIYGELSETGVIVKKVKF